LIKVLIVDDDFMVARIHAGFVGRTPGFVVAGVAHSGHETLRAAAEVAPDLVLLDIHLPDLHGIDVLRQLHERHPHIDIMVITAAREAETVRRALHGGVVHYLMKPFTFEDLRGRLEHYATAHRSLAEAHITDQAEVDRIFGTRATARQTTPKGVSPETADVVEQVLRAAPDPMSAAECADVVGISRVSARRYLEHFLKQGKVNVSLRYGTAGRPERRYVWRRA
jgi:response regulator of citrate/malate metabolism